MTLGARIVLLAFVGLALLSLGMSMALSQTMPRCEPGSNLPMFLMRQFGERPVLEATMPGGAKLYVLVSLSGSLSVVACDQIKCCFRAVGTGAKFLSQGA